MRVGWSACDCVAGKTGHRVCSAACSSATSSGASRSLTLPSRPQNRIGRFRTPRRDVDGTVRRGHGRIPVFLTPGSSKRPRTRSFHGKGIWSSGSTSSRQRGERRDATPSARTLSWPTGGPCRPGPAACRAFSACVPSCKYSARTGDGSVTLLQGVSPVGTAPNPRGLPRLSVPVSDLARRRSPTSVAADSTVGPSATSCLEQRRFRRSPLRRGPFGSSPLQRRHPAVMAARSMRVSRSARARVNSRSPVRP
jgi:hypothetical protein